MNNNREYTSEDIEKLGELFYERGLTPSQTADVVYDIFQALGMTPCAELRKECEEQARLLHESWGKLKEFLGNPTVVNVDAETGEMKNSSFEDFLKTILDLR